MHKNKKAVFVLSVIVLCYMTLNYYHFFSKVINNNVSSVNGTKENYLYGTYDKPLENVQCRKLLAGDTQHILNIPTHWRLDTGRNHLLINDCEKYIQKPGFITSTMTEAEEKFPIAFSILVYKDFPQFERLLRAVWRPNNVYCIHVDSKSDNEFKSQISSLADCFNNVFVHPEPVIVTWGTFTVLKPEILCMQELWKSKKQWKYFINLTGQEFPLKTNFEIVRILTSYSGANDISGAFSSRFSWAGKPPFNITPIKESVHIIASRPYVDYVLHSNVSKAFLEWVKNARAPDETFFTTLNFNPHLEVPGSPIYDGRYHDSMARYKLWYSPSIKCDGKIIRDICIFSVGDLPGLIHSPALFANKFFYEYQPLAYDCLEGWYHDKVKGEKEGRLDFNVSMYHKNPKNYFSP